MDTISYGIANKTKDAESSLRNQTLSSGVEGNFINVKERIDNLEKYLEGLSLRANQLIIHDAVNIMKAHAKLNSIAKTIKYKMQNMIFDDLLDLSGIDVEKSIGYVHDAQNGTLETTEESVIETITETLSHVPSQVILITNLQKNKGISDNLIPAMTSNTTPYGEAFASNPQNISDTGSRLAYFVFDRNLKNSWGGNSVGGPPCWIGYKFENKTNINKYSIFVGSSATVAHPQSWIFQGSNDGEVYEDLHTVLNQKFKENEKKEFSFVNNENFLYYRIYCTKLLWNGYPNIFEVTMGSDNLNVESAKYYISRDNGDTWIRIIPEELFLFDDKIHPKGSNLKLKIELPPNVVLQNYSLTWV
ncbi:discoidin domain-containing protein [Bacillus cereus]|nr:discoidin domain-containing protein [Bacillus cereus]